MKFFLLPVAIMATAAMAQSSACAADYIVEACLGTEKSKLASCASTDYECLCAGHNSLITCFNNCPNDTRVKDAAGQRDIFCGYASQFPSKTTKVNTAAPTAASQTTANSQNGQAAATGSESTAPTTSSTGSPATNSNSAAYLALNAGGVLAAVAGVVAVVL